MAMYCSLSALAYAAYYTNQLDKKETDSLIKNENLLNALVCAPLAILFCFFASHSITSSEHVVFNMVYVLLASYFSLRMLASAAFYTNDHHAENINGAG